MSRTRIVSPESFVMTEAQLALIPEGKCFYGLGKEWYLFVNPYELYRRRKTGIEYHFWKASPKECVEFIEMYNRMHS